MALLNETIKPQVAEILSKLEGLVKLVVFTQGEGGLEEIIHESEHPEVVISGVSKPGGGLECEMCSETRQLAEERQLVAVMHRG